MGMAFTSSVVYSEGSYEVDVVGSTLPPNFTPTTSQAPGSTTANDSNGSPAPVTLTIDTNNNVVSDLTIDFGYVSPCNGAIGDFVWERPERQWHSGRE